MELSFFSLDVIFRLIIFFVPFLFSLCFHEFAHAWVAQARGDNTARLMGRLTLNPLPHMDFIGTLILPVLAILLQSPISFGWAKPVPVDVRNLKNPKNDMFLVALAGPLSNLFLSVVGTLILVGVAHGLRTSEFFPSLVGLLKIFISINLFLAFFNLIPVHPLDGGKVLARFLPNRWNFFLERNEYLSSLVLMLLILTGTLRFLAYPVQWTSQFLIEMALQLL